MNVFSAPVLLVAGLCASPAVYQALVGGVPPEMALTRALVALAASWVGVSLVAMLVGPPRS